MTDLDDLLGQLRIIDEQLRDRAYERLRAAAEDGDARAAADEKRLSQARRAVEKAIQILAGLDAGDV
jgi:hypothetical protein